MSTSEVIEMFHKLVTEGKSIKEISKEIEIPERTLYTWKKKFCKPQTPVVKKTTVKSPVVVKAKRYGGLLQRLLCKYTTSEDKLCILADLEAKGMKLAEAEIALGFTYAEAKNAWDTELATIINDAYHKFEYNIGEIGQLLQKHGIKLSPKKIKGMINK
jgi:transposase